MNDRFRFDCINERLSSTKMKMNDQNRKMKRNGRLPELVLAEKNYLPKKTTTVSFTDLGKLNLFAV